MKELRGKNAILTGGSYGLGPHIARALAREGVNVALAARSADRLARVAEEISSMSVSAVAIPTDVSDPMAREALVTRAEAALGHIDILVNNASVHHVGRLHTRSAEQIQEVINTNLLATMMLTRQVLPGMMRRHSGHIVNMASLAGKAGIPYLALYDASKHGIVGFTHCLQAELHNTDVRATVICSGYMSEEGMWARLNRPVHPAFGLSSPQRVAARIIKAVKRDKVETIINPIPVRPVILLWAVAPGLATRLFRWLRVNKFMEGVALQEEAQEAMEAAPRREERAMAT